ncbi:MAG TPA: aspartate kinase, partial [Tepiditoga sp.]|nr:aspartate kinase [Tepiditoga sp.]
GIYTADPKIHPGAKKLKTISYDEMLEMSGLGAKVLHTRAVEIAKKFGIEIYCGATFSDEEGTTVTMNTIENPVVTGMSIQDDQTLVTVNNLKPDFNTVRNLFETIADNNHNVDMISVINNNGTINLSFSVIEDEREYVENIIKTFLGNMPESVLNYDHNNVKLSVVGIGMRDAKGVASRFFKALSNVPIKLVTTSEIKISCLFTKEYLNDAVKSITEEFGL